MWGGGGWLIVLEPQGVLLKSGTAKCYGSIKLTRIISNAWVCVDNNRHNKGANS